MLDALFKSFFQSLSRSQTVKRLASRYGLANPRSFGRRFIAGETLDEAVAAARQIEARGLLQTLDYLGESVDSLDAAAAATREYLGMVDTLAAAGIERNISLKLTQLGLDVERAACTDHLREIVQAARARDGFVRIDMENSPYTDATLDIFETLWREGLDNIGIVLQSALYRSEADTERVLALGARIRLVKGAYQEPADVAWARKPDVDAAFVRIMQRILTDGRYPAIATHDPHMIAAATRFATAKGIRKDQYEFQMLYGVRRDLQTRLAADGYRVRVYIPFGREWFPYFMRRLGERPANVGFVLRSMLIDR